MPLLSTNLEIKIDQSLPQERLDQFLRRRLPEVSRGTLQRLLAGGSIQVDGRRVKPSHHPRAGEKVTIQWPEAVPATEW